MRGVTSTTVRSHPQPLRGVTPTTARSHPNHCEESPRKWRDGPSSVFLKYIYSSYAYRVDTPMGTHFYQFLFLIDLHRITVKVISISIPCMLYYIKKGLNLRCSSSNLSTLSWLKNKIEKTWCVLLGSKILIGRTRY